MFCSAGVYFRESDALISPTFRSSCGGCISVGHVVWLVLGLFLFVNLLVVVYANSSFGGVFIFVLSAFLSAFWQLVSIP